jgi:hypothetical protein
MSTLNPLRENHRALSAQGRFARVGGPAATGGTRGAFGQVEFPIGLKGSLPQYPQLDCSSARVFPKGEAQR